MDEMNHVQSPSGAPLDFGGAPASRAHRPKIRGERVSGAVAGPLSVLLVEDNPGDVEIVRLELREVAGRPVALRVAPTLQLALRSVDENELDAVLLDLGLPDSRGRETLEAVLDVAEDIPVVVLTGLDDEELGLAAVRHGAQDYLPKGELPTGVLPRALAYAMERKGLIDELERRHRKAHQAEEELRQAQKLEAIGQLAGGVAHDFNNLLQGGMGLVDLLAEEGIDDATVEQLRGVFERGAALTRQLLLFARRESTQRTRLDCREIVTGLSDLLRRLLKENITLNLELGDEPLPLLADRGQLEQVLINLVVNSADAMPDGGKLILRTGSREDRVWLAVEDTGTGIPEEIRERVFDPFFTTKGATKGTGLGLSVVRGIVLSHGGEIELDSTVDRGTAVRVVFPRLAPRMKPRRRPRKREVTVTSTAGKRILLVEDERVVRDLVCRMTERLGCETIAVESAEAALEAARESRFDLLISDMVLPGASGASLAADLRRRWPALKVLLVSGHTEERFEELVDDPDVEFLPKPFDLETLTATIGACLESSSSTGAED